MAAAAAPAVDDCASNLERASLVISTAGIDWGMELSILLVIIGIVLAILVNYILGIIVILIGLAMLLLPRLGTTRRV